MVVRGARHPTTVTHPTVPRDTHLELFDAVRLRAFERLEPRIDELLLDLLPLFARRLAQLLDSCVDHADHLHEVHPSHVNPLRHELGQSHLLVDRVALSAKVGLVAHASVPYRSHDCVPRHLGGR